MYGKNNTCRTQVYTMSEMAIRKTDQQKITIGTGRILNKIRFEDRYKVKPCENSLNPHEIVRLYWRLPLPEEDDMQPGDYIEYDPTLKTDERGRVLSIHPVCCLEPKIEKALEVYRVPSSIYNYHSELDFTTCIPCYHLANQYYPVLSLSPEKEERVSALYLNWIENTPDEILIVINCCFCHSTWSVPFPVIERYMLDEELKKRLYLICSKYWEQTHPGEYYVPPIQKHSLDKKAIYKLFRWENASGDKYGVSVTDMEGDGQVDYFKEFDDAFRLYSDY